MLALRNGQLCYRGCSVNVQLTRLFVANGVKIPYTSDVNDVNKEVRYFCTKPFMCFREEFTRKTQILSTVTTLARP